MRRCWQAASVFAASLAVQLACFWEQAEMKRRLRFALWELGLVAAVLCPGAIAALAPGGADRGPSSPTAATGVAQPTFCLSNLWDRFLLGVLARPDPPAKLPRLLRRNRLLWDRSHTFSSWMLDLVRLKRPGFNPQEAQALLILSLVLGPGRRPPPAWRPAAWFVDSGRQGQPSIASLSRRCPGSRRS